MTREKKSVKWEKVYVFISSTFNDMHAERDYLVKQVFPELREWCERRRLRLVDIDLRWGVTEQDATHNKNVVKVCLSRIDECRPFFLCFLGQRRGWVPKVAEVSGETYKDYPELKDHVGNASVTELEILHAVLEPLHKGNKRDPKKHADYYDKARHAFFFLRDDSYLRQIPSDPPLLRKTYTNEWIVNPEERGKEDASLRTWREIQIPDTGRPVYPYRARWNPDASTPEIMLPLACPSTNTANVGRWAKQWRDEGVAVDGNKVVEKDKAKADEVNRKLSKGRLSDFTCEGKPLNKGIVDSEGKPLHEVIIESLKHAISTDERYADHKEIVQADELQKEIDQQEQFLFINSEGFIGRSGDFEALDDYVKGDSGKLFIITAPGGMGKTMLLANWLDRCESRGLECKGSTFHYRFIGQSDRSTTVPNMLRSLMLELQQVAGKIPKTYHESSKDPRGNEITREAPLEIPHDPEKLMALWLEYLPRLEGKTVIVVDAVNQLESGLADLRWAPLNGLPGHVKLIISFREDAGEGNKLLEKLRGNDHVIHHRIPPFEDIEDRRRLVKAYLDQYLKDIDPAHLEEIIQMKGAGNPLFLKVVLSELRVFGSFQHLPQKIHEDFGDSPVTAFDGVLGRLEKDPAYSSIIPKQAVPLLFGLLSHARYGLSVDELSRLFIQSLTLADNAAGYQSASETVNLFIRQVRPFLALRNGRYDFFYESFRVAATDRYECTKDDLPYRATSQGWHRKLSDYFYQLPLWAGKDEKGNDLPDRRKVSELPYHLTKGCVWARVEEILTGLRFIEAKCAAGMTYELMKDYDVAMNEIPEGRAERETEIEKEREIQRCTREIIEYARQWSEARDRHAQDTAKYPMPGSDDIPLPKVIESVKPWTDEEINEDTKKFINTPTPLHKLKIFSQFVNGEAHNLVKYSSYPLFCIQQAYNSADAGPVHDAACKILERDTETTTILRKKLSLPQFNPHPGTLRTLEGHTRLVEAVSLTPDGRRAVSGSSDKMLRVWDVEIGQWLRTLEGHKDDVLAVSLTLDGRCAVSGSVDKTLRVWDVESGQCLRTLEGHTGSVYAVSLTPDGRCAVSGSGDKTLRVWDVETGECLLTLEGHTGGVNAVSLTPDGRRAVSGSWDKTLRVWDVETGQCLRTLEGHTDWVEAVSLTPDGRCAVSGSGDNTLRVWDVETGRCLRTLEGHRDVVIAVSLTPDGCRAVSGSEDETLRVWDVESGQCLRVLEGHMGFVNAVSLTLDGYHAVSGSSDRTLRVWNMERGQCLRTPEGQTRIVRAEINTVIQKCKDVFWRARISNTHCVVRAVTLTPDGRHAVSRSALDALRVWDVESGQCLRTLEGITENCPVFLTTDGRCALSQDLEVFDMESGQCLRTLEGHMSKFDEAKLLIREGQTNSYSPLSLTPDGRRAVSGSSDKTLWVWDVESGRCLRTLEGHTGSVYAVSLTPDGRRAVSGSDDNTLRVWDVETGECLLTLEGHAGGVNAVSLTPDGRRAISGSNDSVLWGWRGSYGSTLRVWDVESGQCLHTLKGHTDSVNAVSLTPDGRRAVSGSEDKTLRVWDVETGRCLRTLEGHTGGVKAVSLTPDGRRAVSGGWDKTLRVWDVESGKQIAMVPLAGMVTTIAIKGHQIIAGDSVCMVSFFNVQHKNMEIYIVTLLRLWQYGVKGNPRKWDDNITTVCGWCGKRIVAEKKILDTIAGITRDARFSPEDSPCLKLPAEAFNDPRLVSACPHCHQPLKFNPFVVDNKDRY